MEKSDSSLDVPHPLIFLILSDFISSTNLINLSLYFSESLVKLFSVKGQINFYKIDITPYQHPDIAVEFLMNNCSITAYESWNHCYLPCVSPSCHKSLPLNQG